MYDFCVIEVDKRMAIQLVNVLEKAMNDHDTYFKSAMSVLDQTSVCGI